MQPPRRCSWYVRTGYPYRPLCHNASGRQENYPPTCPSVPARLVRPAQWSATREAPIRRFGVRVPGAHELVRRPSATSTATTSTLDESDVAYGLGRVSGEGPDTRTWS